MDIFVLILGVFLFLTGLIGTFTERIRVGGRAFRIYLQGPTALIVAVPQTFVGFALIVLGGVAMLGYAIAWQYLELALGSGICFTIFAFLFGVIITVIKRL